MKPKNTPVELSPVDIEPWRQGNTGLDWVHLLDSGRPGPTVLVQALTHGNELCGAIALDWFMRQRIAPLQGRLALVFANVQAYHRFDPQNPNASRCVDEDYNRVWGDDQLFGPRDSVELRRARQLQPLVDSCDLVLDLHSMSEPCAPLMVCGKVDKNAHYARQLGMPELLMLDTGHPAGLRMVDRGGFGDPNSPKRALLIECGQHWERAAADVATDALVRFLALTGMVTPQWAQAHQRLPLPAQQRTVRVTEAITARSADFKFLVPVVAMHVIPKAGTPVAQDADHIWLSPYDDAVMVMPGLAHVKPGNTMVRLGRYVDI